MLDFEQAEENLTRRYRREETLSRLERIRRLKESGLSVSGIKEYIQSEERR